MTEVGKFMCITKGMELTVPDGQKNLATHFLISTF